MGIDKVEDDAVLFQRLKGLVNVYHHAALWIMDWCRHECEGTAAGGTEGFSVHGHELDCMLVDREELLSQMIAGEQDHPLVREERIVTSLRRLVASPKQIPGVPVKWHARRDFLFFKPNPRYLRTPCI